MNQSENQSELIVAQNEEPTLEPTFSTVVTEKDVLYFNENPVIVKTIYTDGRPDIYSITKDSTNIIALCENGTIQKTSIEPNLTSSKMDNI